MPRKSSSPEIGENPSKRAKDDASEGSDDDDDEPEYEIEEVIDAKRGQFPKGRLGYFVKWKGYESSENSWVDELDAGNAQELIDIFWKKNKAKKDALMKPAAKARQSTGANTSTRAAASASAAGRKRGRKSNAPETEESDNDMAVDRRSPINKRARKGTKSAVGAVDMSATPEPGQELKDMEEYMSLKSWEDIVASVDTIEREQDGELTVYFTLNNGEQMKEKSPLCKARFPQKLLSFYEDNLRWKVSGEDD